MLKSVAIGVVCLLGLSAQQLKEGEYEPYNLAIKDLNSGDFAKAIHDLDAWKAQFPSTDYADTRTALYVQTYTGLNQPAKALEAARSLLAKDLKSVFPGPAGQAMIIRLLYNSTWAIAHCTDPSPEDREAGEKAARQLIAYDEILPGVAADQWAAARADMKEKANAALVYIAMLPGIQDMAKKPQHCAGAEAAYTRALGKYPDQATISYELGRALNCQGKSSAALYEFQRAAAIDPAKIKTFADNAYIRSHGSDEGLEDLRAQVKQSPLPPPDFAVKTADEVEAAKNAAWEADNPELALWKKIRGALTQPDGPQFFDRELKDAKVPLLKGTLVGAKPACRPTELSVAVEGARPEVVLKLDKPLAGTPELNAEMRWEGAGAAFTPEPFRLTMDTSADQIQGLKIGACSVRKK